MLKPSVADAKIDEPRRLSVPTECDGDLAAELAKPAERQRVRCSPVLGQLVLEIGDPFLDGDHPALERFQRLRQ